MVNQVAVAAADENYKVAQRELRSNMERIVRGQVDKMAKDIAGKLYVQDAYRGPYGEVRITSDDFGRGWREGADAAGSRAYVNVLSDTARAAGFQPTFKLQDTGIKWAKRSRRYLAWKKKNGMAGYWWKKTGRLKSWLNNAGRGRFYEQAFGPVRVLFTRQPNAKLENPLLTKSGLSGKISQTVSVGRLEVLVFNRITPSMMPGLASMDPRSNPLPGLGVARLLASRFPNNAQVRKLAQQSFRYDETKYQDQRIPADEIHQKIWRKKWRMKRVKTVTPQGGKNRPALDPFVSFYLTRAIPNAVWRRTEQFVQRKVITNVVRKIN